MRRALINYLRNALRRCCAPSQRLGLIILALVACHGGHATEPTNDDEPTGAFTDRGGFVPRSFTATVTGPKSGRPIIFIPGLGCPGEVWAPTVAHLGDAYQAHVLTLAGFAGKPPIKQPLSAMVRKELTRYIRSHQLDHPIIVGHSMGGLIAYWLAERHPDLVGPVVVVDAGPALSDTDPDTAKRLRDLWVKATEEDFDHNARGVFSQMVSDPKAIAPYLDAIARSDQRTMGDAIYELVTTDLRDRVAGITAPVLIVLADGIFQDQIRAQVAPIAHKDVRLMKGAKHFVFLDDPKTFYELLDRFFLAHAPKT